METTAARGATIACARVGAQGVAARACAGRVAWRCAGRLGGGMKLQLKRIDPISAGKVMGGFYAALTLLFVPVVLLMGLFATLAGSASFTMTSSSGDFGGGPMLPGMGIFAGMGLFFALMIPVFYGVMGFVMGALMALVYNLICRWLGGLVLDFEPKDVAPEAAPAASEPGASPDGPPSLPARL